MSISLSRKSGRTGKPAQGGVGLKFLSSTKVSVPIFAQTIYDNSFSLDG